MLRIIIAITILLGFVTSVSAQSCTPVNGGWSEWSGCNEQCFQQRLCNNPLPSCGGASCTGTAIISCNTGACSKCGDNYCSPKENHETCSVDCSESVTPTPTSTPDPTPTGSGSITVTPVLPGTGLNSNSRSIFDTNPALLIITIIFILLFGSLTTVIIWKILKKDKLKKVA